MNDKVKMIVVGVVSLVVGAAGGGGYGMMQVDDVTQKLMAATQEKEQAVQNADRLRKMSDEAGKKYGKDLGKLVAAAAPAVVPGTDPAADDAKLLDGVRAILALRDGFRASLDGVRASMDPDMDALAAELGNPTPNISKVKELLDGLKQNWPDKEKNIQTATQKLLGDLGLVQAPAAPKPAASAPAAAPAPAAAAAAPATAATAAAPATAPAATKK
jgi:hypothetical protein